RTTIITVELGKVEKLAQKPVDDMTTAESWAVYLRYNADEAKRGLLEAISAKDKGVAMAQEAFLTVSRDERERARLLSEYKFAMDLQDRMITAREEGWEEGIELGTAKGIELGTTRGQSQVLDLLRQGLSADEIERRLAGST
ncbi:MAG: hypothetical protein LBU17_04495, partial [Treponema sp.]|nr:hypothetical protein [Treponema sp.]